MREIAPKAQLGQALLEPIMKVEVVTPEELYWVTVIGDLNSAVADRLPGSVKTVAMSRHAMQRHGAARKHVLVM